VAFLMAEFIGVPYIRVAAAAVIPAVLYFGAVYFAVDFRARKRSLRGVSDEDVPNWKASLAKYAHMLLPLVALVYLLIKQYTPLLAAFVSLVIAYVLSWLRKDTRLNLNATVKVAVDSSKAAVSVAVAMANAGFIIGVLGMTGLGLILTDTIIAVSGGFVLVSLLLVAIVTIVLGMGLPTTGAFVIGSTIAAPILIKMGTPVLVANFFVLYYACLSTITPPVALAAYVGAGMAGANPNKVGWTAFRLALPGLLIAFFFAQNPALLLIADNAWGIIFPTITSLIGIMLFAAGSEGYFFGVGNLPVVARVSLIAAAVLLLDPRYITDVIALGVLVFGAVLPTVIIRLMQVRRRGAAAGRKPAAAG
jgi:TRAP transporter 4TM/12TM fusion protein